MRRQTTSSFAVIHIFCADLNFILILTHCEETSNHIDFRIATQVCKRLFYFETKSDKH